MLIPPEKVVNGACYGKQQVSSICNRSRLVDSRRKHAFWRGYNPI